MDEVETVVVGAGVIGLAIAKRLAEAGKQVLLLERNLGWGQETSSRNSEVLHAGLYYPPGSLRAELCLEGYDRLRTCLIAEDLPWRLCGKLIVACDPSELSALEKIADNALASGAPALQQLSASEAKQMEPHLHCTAALWSERTAIFDSHRFMAYLLGRAAWHGAELVLNCKVQSLELVQDGYVLRIQTSPGEPPYQIKARQVINAAGHGAVALAQTLEAMPAGTLPSLHFARGTWYSAPGIGVFSRLIYPVPEPGGLGIHLTLDLQGAMRFGPDVEWIDEPSYQLSDHRRAEFADRISRYWPGLPANNLYPIACGVRPKLSGPGEVAADFRIDGPVSHGLPGLVHLFGIESPGLTASLAIAERVFEKLS